MTYLVAFLELDCGGFTFQTSVFRVSRKASRTELADWFVILNKTGSILWTGGVLAGVNTSVVGAGLLRRAAIVSEADGQGRVAVFRTQTDRAMVDNFTDPLYRAQ